jgi:Uma2 family endonuclease
MTSPLESMSAIVTPRMRISVDRYQKMVASGVLTSSDRVELIEGDILNSALVTPMHASVTARLLKRLILTVGDNGWVGPSNPVDLGEFSEPEPDVVVLKPQHALTSGAPTDPSGSAGAILQVN